MEREEALEQAHDYLKRGNTAEWLKERSRKNEDLTYMGLAHVVADVIQRGVNPGDVDFQKIDWGVSYGNIRGQAQDLADQRGGEEFGTEKRDRIKSSMEKAEAMKSSRRHERLKDKAETVQKGRSKWARYSDQVKTASRTFQAPITKGEYKKWRRNPDGTDIEGVDDRRPPSQRTKISQFPFEKSIEKRKKEMMMKNVEEEPDRLGMDLKSEKMAIRDSVKAMTGSNNSSSISWNGQKDSGKTNFSDSRSTEEVKSSLKGSTSERSNQKSLRERGFLSEGSEKSLDKFKNNII
jgi:hypothetical protein